MTPHASFLALRYAPREAVDNLRNLATRFPIYSQFGFLDSVDVSAGLVSGCVLALDQGMIMAAIANELADDAMQHAFSDGFVEQSIRPLIAMEEFSAGILMGRPAQPADIAGTALYLASADSDYMTGQVVMIDGGMVLV